MSPLPTPMSRAPTLPQPRRKGSLRTASKEAQRQFGDRLRQLAEDPTRILPECIGDEPRAVAKVRRRLEAMRKGPSLFDRFDRGIVGAVAQSIRLAKAKSFPRLLDGRIGDQRRFYLHRGQVDRGTMLAVQNHDEPRALLLAWTPTAKKQGLHFFATDRLWCTGSTPAPPDEWVEAIATKANITLTDLACPHDEARVALVFRGGPSLKVCAACGEAAKNLHKIVARHYAGPRTRQPVEVKVVMPDGEMVELDREKVAAYRAAVASERELIQEGLRAWRGDAKGRYALGGRMFADHEAFLDALEAAPYERLAIAAMTKEGYVGEPNIARILEDQASKMPDGLEAILGPDAAAWAADKANMAPRDLLRAARDEAERRKRVAAMPQVPRLGPVGTALDKIARAHRGGGKADAMALCRDAVASMPHVHLAAITRALGGDLATESRLHPSAKEAAAPLVAAAKALLVAEGDAYVEALRHYLQTSGTGEG